ncbi:MAG: guanylate kinase, partial [Clostridiales bacterium]|nr:guanylate kinase [Clostridiales bacterium]
RKKRDNEIDGVNYYFTSPEEFERNIKAGNMLEYAEYSGNYYGTPKEPVDKMLSRGINVVLKIEVQGAGNIRRIYPDAVSVFIMPKSLEILEQRLRLRSTDSQEAVLKRLKTAEEEIKRIDEYDYLIINDEIEKACSDFESIIRAEQLKVR